MWGDHWWHLLQMGTLSYHMVSATAEEGPRWGACLKRVDLRVLCELPDTMHRNGHSSSNSGDPFNRAYFKQRRSKHGLSGLVGETCLGCRAGESFIPFKLLIGGGGPRG